MSPHGSGADIWNVMKAALQSLETYVVALETPEFLCLLLTALDELLKAPEANAIQLQELIDVLLQMIEFPIDLQLPIETVTVLLSAQDWAIQKLFNVQAYNQFENLLQGSNISRSLQQMQSTLFVSAPWRDSDIETELHQSLLIAVKSEEESTRLCDSLEMCAAMLQRDTQFLQFAEIALSGKCETLRLGSVFLQRVFDLQSYADGRTVEQKVRRGQRLFDLLSLESKIAVWANHPPSWRSQLQSWMLVSHRASFEPISSVLPDGRWLTSCLGADAAISVIATCQRYSHLYVTFIDWCRFHVDLFSTCRSMELVNALSRSIRQEDATCLFDRQLLSHVSLVDCSQGSWSCDQRERAFNVIGINLERLYNTRNASDVVWQYEWIGVLERPYLLHEALELAFCGATDSGMENKDNVDQSTVRSSVQFFSWFYSFPSSQSVYAIASLLITISSELKDFDICSGAQWLRRNRAEFGFLPIVRLRLVWFWLLKTIDAGLQTPGSSIDEGAINVAMIDVLESVEYIFRRFTPAEAKRSFQVEFVTQALVELEWRAMKTKTKDKFVNAIEPVWTWLTKIVRLMQLEMQLAHQNDSKNGHGNCKIDTNDVEQLVRRKERFELMLLV